MIDKLVKQTIHFSLFIQVITTLLSLDGFTIKIPQQDFILKEILAIETIVQLVEGFFYTWIIFALNDLKKMTPRRYIDWSITTPIMLFSTIIFFKYNELKENGQMTNFTTYEFVQENRENMTKIFIFNGLMLLCGFLGEIGVIDKRIGIPLGFVFFYKSFEIIYTEYAVKTELGKQLFNILAGLWSLYGVSAMLPLQQKNIAYNMLDIVAKNFYGLYIYYKIKELRIYN
jgi:hypothetical protein